MIGVEQSWIASSNSCVLTCLDGEHNTQSAWCRCEFISMQDMSLPQPLATQPRSYLTHESHGNIMSDGRAHADGAHGARGDECVARDDEEQQQAEKISHKSGGVADRRRANLAESTTYPPPLIYGASRTHQSKIVGGRRHTRRRANTLP